MYAEQPSRRKYLVIWPVDGYLQARIYKSRRCVIFIS